MMERTLAQFRRLLNAEDFFAFFDLPYDQRIVRVSRLHILKKFSLYMREFDRKQEGEPVEEDVRLQAYRRAFERAYEDLACSSGVEQRLFKVFHRRGCAGGLECTR